MKDTTGSRGVYQRIVDVRKLGQLALPSLADACHQLFIRMREQHSMGLSETGRWLLDPSEVLRLPGRRSLVLFRSDILRYPVLASKVNYRSWRHWRWWRKYDRWQPA